MGEGAGVAGLSRLDDHVFLFPPPVSPARSPDSFPADARFARKP